MTDNEDIEIDDQSQEINDQLPEVDDQLPEVEDQPPEADDQAKVDTPPQEDYKDGYDNAKASDPVKRRVNKLWGKLHAAEREREFYKEQYEAASSRLVDREKEQAKANEDQWGEQENEIQASMDAAVADEDFAALAKSTRAMHKLNQQRFVATKRTEPAPQKPEPKDHRPQMAAAAREWVDDNAEWFTEEGENYDSRLARRAIRLSNTIKAETGWDDGDPELYEELNVRLNGKRNQEPTERAPEFSRGKGSDSAGVSRGARKPVASSKTLSAHDKQNMKRYMLDPNNPEHERAYLEGKTA